MANSSVDECPECGALMVIRKNKTTGEQFFGCSRYPDCEGTRSARGNAPYRDTDKAPSERAASRDKRRWERE